MKKSYSIIIVPGDHSGTRQYRLSRQLLLAAATLLILLIVVVSSFVFTYSRILMRATRADELEGQNALLRDQLRSVENINQELEDLSALRAQVLMMLGNEARALEDMVQEMPDRSTALDMNTLDHQQLQHLLAEEGRRKNAPRIWPVDGRIQKEFFRSSDQEREDHPGVDIRSRSGASVLATGDGRVVEIGMQEDGKSYLILDHGFGYHTLYAGVENILTQEGQLVEQGQALGHLGDEGRSRQARLYYEVRIDSIPVDPRGYLLSNGVGP